MKLIGLGVRPGGATLTKGVQGLAGWVGRVGFDQAVQTLAQKTNPKTGQPFGEHAAKKVVGKLKGLSIRAKAGSMGEGSRRGHKGHAHTMGPPSACPACAGKA